MGGGGAPCGACKFLRRKCVKGCIFAPYFITEDLGAPQFGAIHKVFGASNFSKLLMHIPVEERHDAVVSVSYEAQARLQDPIYGCVSHIFALQHQVASLQAKLSMAHAQLACNMEGASLTRHRSEHSASSTTTSPYSTNNNNTSTHYNNNNNNNTQYFPCYNMEDGRSNYIPSDYSSCSTTSTGDVFNPNSTSDEGDLQAFALALLRRGQNN